MAKADTDKWMGRILEQIVHYSHEHLLITDGDGVVRLVGPTCEAIYGKKQQELLGRNVRDLEEAKIFSPSATRLVLESGEAQTMMQETIYKQKLMVSAFPIWKTPDELEGVVSFSHDLTEILELKRRYENLTQQLKQFENEIEELREKNSGSDQVVAVSPAMKEIYRLVEKVAGVDSTVLILGESGVGKNVIAREIHQRSRRSHGELVEINCGSIPDGLLESELFGYEAGSFTGAAKAGKMGIIERANQGTLFLDELGELPLSLQAKLLKVIQEKRLQRIGSTTYREVDFRLIAATNRDLEEMVRNGTFRQDLYFRLHVIPLRIPPLRERKEDIAAHLKWTLRSLNDRYGLQRRLSSQATQVLLKYDWPGNVRELENVLERMVVIADEDTLTAEHLPAEISSLRLPAILSGEHSLPPTVPLKEAVERLEKSMLEQAANICQTTIEMAQMLGISQPSVVRKLKKYQIKRFKNE
ncbi:Fis family transcriptional regulator [Brevibacillus laterosporus]|uniref:sigma-54 interaction domain-containing protein n=1 Tax=Brevibacillus laterosporus TaxID=1465 RepID=UPI000C761B63|nr:sigma 54-interacting transcriptional regulator [Brevibacillus laterosporus]AUM63951.1 Fis family transcriptional regulator [Brevibacillus laterosporus]